MAKQDSPVIEEALIKEVCRLIRVALLYWDAHNNAACRGERDLPKAAALPQSGRLRERYRALFPLQHLEQKTERADSAHCCECGCATVVRNTSVRTERRPSRHENKLNLTANVLTTNSTLQF